MQKIDFSYCKYSFIYYMDAYLIEISLRQLLKNGLIEEFKNSKELNESESIIKAWFIGCNK